jgi:hypothetical protein
MLRREVAMRHRTAGLILVFSCFAAGTAAPTAAQTRIHLPEEERPPVLEGIGVPEGLTTLSISADGDRAAAVFVEEEDPLRSTVLFYSTSTAEPARLELTGLVRDLLYAPDSRSVLGLLHKPAKKREGDTYLMRFEVDPPRARRIMRLPPSARSLDFWPAINALLVASRNEIRTLSFPELRSGPLYRVTGENLAVASLGERGLILVGQESGLLLIDLDDPPGDREMPVRERVASAHEVLSLAAAADGSRALARLADGTVHGVELRPLRLTASGVPGPMAAAEKPLPIAPRVAPDDHAIETETDELAAPVPVPLEEKAEGTSPPPEEATAEPPTPTATRATAPTTPARDPLEEKAEETSPPPEEATAEPPAPTETEPVPRATPRRPPAEREAEPPAEPEARAAPEGERQVRGRISGPAAGQVVAVVFLGPDNVLREALRVVPGEAGRWIADGLAPGRYRVQLDGGGSTVIVSEPPFLLLDLSPGRPVDAGEIRALQAL